LTRIDFGTIWSKV